jgi:DNA polymerase-3 subunit epsilon
VVDLETTGLDRSRDEIISFAAIPVTEGRIRPGELVSALVRPARPPSREGIRIHGLRQSDLVGQPTIDQQIELIQGALQGRILVAHCALIETQFLGAALAAYGHCLEEPVIDTMALGKVVLESRGIDCPDAPDLGFLSRSLRLPIHRPHHADGDALTTAQVFLALASLLHRGREREPTVGELAHPRRRRLLRRLLHGTRGPAMLGTMKEPPSLPEVSSR